MKLYYMPVSPPSRSVLMTIRCLGIDVEIIPIDLLKDEHKTREFKKINPISQIPVLDDDGFILTESVAIMTYLVNSKKPGHALYPVDLKKRAIMDSKLLFSTTFIFENIRNALVPIILSGAKEAPLNVREKLSTALKYLDNILNENPYVAGEDPTLADISILSNIAHLKFCFNGIPNLPNLEAWYKRCENLPGYDECLNAAMDGKTILEALGIKLAPLE